MTGPALNSEGTEAGSYPHFGTTESEEKHLRLRVKHLDLWQPKWNENQTVLATAIHTPDGAVAGSWSLGIVEQFQGEGCC